MVYERKTRPQGSGSLSGKERLALLGRSAPLALIVAVALPWAGTVTMVIAIGTILAFSRPAEAARSSHAALPPFSYTECVALIGDEASDVSDYLAGHRLAGSERAARHCSALDDVEQGDPEQAAVALDRLAHEQARDPGSEADATTAGRAIIAADAARAWLAAGSAKHAEDSAAYGLDLTPGSVPLRLLRDRALLRQGRNDDALGDLLALPLDARSSGIRDRAETHVLRAMAERATGRLPAALTDIDAAIALSPEDPAAMLERGIIRQRTGDIEGARRDWDAVIRLSPDAHEADLARQDLALLAADPDAVPISQDTPEPGAASRQAASEPRQAATPDSVTPARAPGAGDAHPRLHP